MSDTKHPMIEWLERHGWCGNAAKVEAVKNLHDDLIGKRGWNPPAWVYEMVLRDGKCAYCGSYLLDPYVSWHAMQLDHLLPKGRYPAYTDLSVHPDNAVLCCVGCNTLKHDRSPIDDDKDTGYIDDILKNKREELIERVRQYVQDEHARKSEPDRQKIREALRHK